MYIFSLKEKLKALAQLLWQALLPSGEDTPGRERREGGRETNLQHLIMATMIQWAQQPIHSPELIQQIFALLYRQCDEINEVVRKSGVLDCGCMYIYVHVYGKYLMHMHIVVCDIL